ncbi:MAG: aspartate-semialdehyde dehydrogenase [Gemmatimonadales bacterium]
MSDRIDVGLIGATGTVGRRLAQLLEGHPWFRLAELGASPGSAGRSFAEALLGDGEASEVGLGADILGLRLKLPDEDWSSTLLLSALPSREAGPLEAELARRGHVVVSNASSHRMDPDVPLVIPEVNPDHLALIERQDWPGALVTNPNCSVVGLAVALAPLQRSFGLERVNVVTLQALSGAGRPGRLAEEVIDNVLPNIAGEEEKLAREPQKILGRLEGGVVRPAAFAVSAQTHRVSVSDGHLLAVSVELEGAATVEEVAGAMAGFEGAVIDERLPSTPERLIEVLDDEMRPQPRLDRERGGGMTVSVGRVRRCEVLDVKFSVLVHNLVRGAAGAALLNAELCHVCGTTARTPSR